MKKNLPVVFSASCILLLFGVIALQFEQQSRNDRLRQQQETLLSTFTRQHQEQLDSAAEVAKQVTTLGVSLESRLLHCEQLVKELGADEMIAMVSKQLVEGVAEAVEQTKLQLSSQLERISTERATKSEQLLTAAGGYEEKRPELAQLCYVSAFNGSEGTADSSLKKFLDWKQRVFENMKESEVLEESPARLMLLYQALDKGLPDSMVSPKEMEDALLRVDRIANGISLRQQAKMDLFKTNLDWNKFVSKDLRSYEDMAEVLERFSPVNEMLETQKLELQQLTDNFIQTATALQSDLRTGLVPPSPRASPEALGEWLKYGIDQVKTPTNPLQARIAGLTVLMEFANIQSEIPKLSLDAMRGESEKLACEDWCGHVDDYGEIMLKGTMSEAESMAVGQSLLNQGFGILKSFTNKSFTSGVSAKLPGLVLKLFLQRETFLVDQMKLASDSNAWLSKEQAARARSLPYGQMFSALFELRTVEAKLIKECNPSPEELSTLNGLKTNFGEYITAFDKFDQADQKDDKLRLLLELKQGNLRYRNYCFSQIQEAKQFYAGSEKLASKFFTNWSNAEVQTKLKRGLQALYACDTNDLNRADPGLYADWCQTDEKLKKQFLGNPSEVNAPTMKKSIADF